MASFEFTDLIIAQSNFIISKVERYILTGGNPPSYQNDILNQMGKPQLITINNMYPTWIDKSNNKNVVFKPMMDKVTAWRAAVSVAFDAVCVRVDR